jgi:hypothetical protein
MFVVSDLAGLAAVGWYIRDRVKRGGRVLGVGVGVLFVSYFMVKRVAGYLWMSLDGPMSCGHFVDDDLGCWIIISSPFRNPHADLRFRSSADKNSSMSSLPSNLGAHD